MIRGIIKTSLNLARNSFLSKVMIRPSPFIFMRGKVLHSTFSEEKDQLISRINQGFHEQDLEPILIEIGALEMQQKEEALIHMYLGIAKARLSHQILSNPNYIAIISQFQKNPIYVKSLGLRFQHLASNFLMKVRKGSLSNEEASKYLQQMDDLKNKGFAAAHHFEELESFVMSLPFVRLQMTAQINYITYMKQGKERIVGLSEAMEFFESTTLTNLNKTLEGVTKFSKEEKNEQNTNFNRLLMSIALVFCQNILQFFETANNIFSYSGDTNLFKEHVTTFMKMSEVAVNVWERIQYLHPSASYMVHLKKKRLIGQYYLEKLKMKQEKKQDEDFKKLRQNYHEKLEDLYCDLRDKYLEKTEAIPQIVAIHMELVHFMSEIFEELELPPEEMEKRFKEEKEVICSIISKEPLRKKFEIYLDSYIKKYMQEREHRKLFLFDNQL